MELPRRLVPALWIVVFTVVGAGYIGVTPPWEAPDEPWHLAYAEALARGSLPSSALNYEAHQAPGYYLGLGLLLRLLDVGEVDRATGNPYFPWAEAAYWHPPEAEEEGIVAVLRTVTGFFAAAAVALAWATGRRLAPSDPGVASLAAAFVALLPQYQHIGHSLNNDAAATVAGGVLAYGGVRLVTLGAPGTAGKYGLPAFGRTLGGAAVSLAFAFGAKATAWPIVLAPALGVVVAMRRGRMRKRGALWLASAGVASVVIAAIALHFLMPAVAQAMWADVSFRSQRVRPELTDWRTLATLTRETLIASWATFGWLTVELPQVLTIFVGALVVIGVLGTVHRFRTVDSRSRDAMVVAGMAVIAAWGAWSKNVVADPQPQGRLLFGALVAGAGLLSLGWRVSGRRELRNAASGAIVAFLLVANVNAVAATIPNAYARWRIPARPVAEHILPAPAVIAARLRRPGASVRQTFEVVARPADVALAVHRAVGHGAIRITLTDPVGGVLASATHDLTTLKENRWLHLAIDATEPRRGGDMAGNASQSGHYAIAVTMLYGDGELELWGSATDVYERGALTIDGIPGADLALIVLADVSSPQAPRGP